jgi:hypothetical protein
MTTASIAQLARVLSTTSGQKASVYYQTSNADYQSVVDFAQNQAANPQANPYRVLTNSCITFCNTALVQGQGTYITSEGIVPYKTPDSSTPNSNMQQGSSSDSVNQTLQGKPH